MSPCLINILLGEREPFLRFVITFFALSLQEDGGKDVEEEEEEKKNVEQATDYNLCILLHLKYVRLAGLVSC